MSTTVYSGRVTNWPLFWVANLLGLALVALSGLGAPGLIAVAVVVVGANLVVSSVRTTAGPNGVVVRFGILGVPRFRYPIADIAGAEAVDVPFSRMGGWGVHWSPWRGTRLTIRSGPQLRLHLTDGRTVTISANDPAAAASVVGHAAVSR